MLFNTIVLETERQVQASTTSLGFKCYFKQRDDFLFFFFVQLVSSLCHDLKVMESFKWNDKERYIYLIIKSG